MVIRHATERDLPGILAVYNDVVATTTAIYRDTPATLEDRRTWWTSRVEAGYPVLVAGDEDVEGFASFGDFRSWPGYRYTVEHSVHVRADRRGCGVGRALMLPLIEDARRLGKHVMVGGVDADNVASLRFHERLGFRQAARLDQVGFKFGRWLDLVFVQLVLGPMTPEP